MKKIESSLLNTFPNKIINTHPQSSHQFMEGKVCMEDLYMKQLLKMVKKNQV